MAAFNGLDKMSYVQLLALQERVEEGQTFGRRTSDQRTAPSNG